MLHSSPFSPIVAPLPPGPNALQGLQAIYDSLKFLDESVLRYGDIVRLDKLNYLINGPEHIEHVLVDANQIFVRDIYDDIDEAVSFWGHGLITNKKHEWLPKRRLLQRIFRHEYLIPYSLVMVEYAARMVEQWQDEEIRDIYRDMRYLSFSIAVRNMLGIILSTDRDLIWNALNATLNLFEHPAQLHLPIVTPAKNRFKRLVKPMDELVYRVIEQRRASGRNFGDMLSMLLLVQGKDGYRMTDDEIRDETVMMLRSQHKNSSANLAWIWHALAQHPEVQAKLAEEVDRILKGRLPTVHDLPRLTYTEMVVKEVMRLYPLYPTLTRRAMQDHLIGGYYIPAGATVIVSAWLMHRDSRYFAQPTRFNPSRWEDHLCRHPPKFAYFPFGGGPHQCLVQSYAMMEAILLTAIIIQKFQIKSSPGHVVTQHASFNGMRPKNGVRVVLRKR